MPKLTYNKNLIIKALILSSVLLISALNIQSTFHNILNSDLSNSNSYSQSLSVNRDSQLISKSISTQEFQLKEEQISQKTSIQSEGKQNFLDYFPEFKNIFSQMQIYLEDSSSNIYEQISYNSNKDEKNQLFLNYQFTNDTNVNFEYSDDTNTSKKQLIILENKSDDDRSYQLTLSHELNSPSIKWDGEVYDLTQESIKPKAYIETVEYDDPQFRDIFPDGIPEEMNIPKIEEDVMKGHVIEFIGENEQLVKYNFSDIVSTGVEYEINIYSQNDRYFFDITFLNLDVPSNNSIEIDPIYDLQDSNNFNLRVEGANAGDNSGWFNFSMGDIDGNGYSDLIFPSRGTDFNGSNTGSNYIFFDEFLLDKINDGKGTSLHLADTQNFNIRIDCPPNSVYCMDPRFSDYNSDGKLDLILPARRSNVLGRNLNGVIYFIDNSVLNSFGSNTTGNILDLSDPSYIDYTLVGASNNAYFGSGFEITDFDNDNLVDFLISSSGTGYNGRNLSGSVYIIESEFLLSNPSGTILDMSNSNNYSVRFDGPRATPIYGLSNTQTGYINNDKKPDLVISSLLSDAGVATYAGEVFFIMNDRIPKSTTGINIDLSDPNTYDFRIHGATSNRFTRARLVSDIVGDDKSDIILSYSGNQIISNEILKNYLGGNNLAIPFNANPSSYTLKFSWGWNFSSFDYYLDNKEKQLFFSDCCTDYSGTDRGSGWLVSTKDFDTLPNGTLYDMDDPDNFIFRFDGDQFTTAFHTSSDQSGDINNDGKLDFTFGTDRVDHNGLIDSGAGWLVLNYPHTITTDKSTITTTNEAVSITGSVDADLSVSKIDMVQYSINNSNFEGTWNNCGADDGSYDEFNEGFTCKLNSLTPGTYTIYIRSYDENGSYTAESNYKSVVVTVNPIIYPTKQIQIEYEITPISPIDEIINEQNPTFIWEELIVEGENIFYDLYVDKELIAEKIDTSEFALPEEFGLLDGEHNWSIFAFTKNEEEYTQIAKEENIMFEVNLNDDIVSFPLSDNEDLEEELIVSDDSEISESNTNNFLFATLIPFVLSIPVVGIGTFLNGNVLFGFLFGWIFKRKKRYWGITFDKFSSKIIPFTIVRLRDPKTSAVISQTVSDQKGRFGLLADFPGKFILEVRAAGFKNYTKEIIIPDSLDVVVDVGLEKVDEKVSFLKRIFYYNKVHIIKLARILILVLMFIGFSYSFVVTVLYPVLINYLILIGYFILFVINLYIFIKSIFKANKGVIFDFDSKVPLDNTSVRIYKGNNQLDVLLTNTNGQVKFNLTPGVYTILVKKEGYEPKKFDAQLQSNGSFKKNIFLKKSSSSGQNTPSNSKFDNPFSKN